MVFQGQSVHSDSPHPTPCLWILSGTSGLEKKEAVREAARADRWDAVHHRIPAGGSGERQHQHWSAQKHGLRCQGHEVCSWKHVRASTEAWSTGTKPLCTDYFCNFLFVTETKASIKKIQSVLKWSEILQGGFADNEMHIISPTCSNPFFYAFISVSICKM